jgi:hypothetical protein
VCGSGRVVARGNVDDVQVAARLSARIAAVEAATATTHAPPPPHAMAMSAGPSGALLVGNTAVNGTIGGLTAALP